MVDNMMNNKLVELDSIMYNSDNVQEVNNGK